MYGFTYKLNIHYRADRADHPRLKMPLIVKTCNYDGAELSMGATSTSAKFGIKRMDISYQGSPFLLQTPVFDSCRLQEFKGKEAGDSSALVLYASLRYMDEVEFGTKVVHNVNDEALSMVIERARDVYNKKNMKEDTIKGKFKSSINDQEGFCPSFKTNIIIDDRQEPVNCEFYDGEGKSMTTEEFKAATKSSFSARMILCFTHVYVQGVLQLGVKSCARVIQLMPKPEEDKVETGNCNTVASGGASKAPLGLCFQ